jgi:hypothetical protein
LPFTAEGVAAGRRRLVEQYGMPMSEAVPTVLPSTLDACRAYVGARMHEPDKALALLRGLRVRAHSDDQPLDSLETLQGAADDAGIARDALDGRLAGEAVEAELRGDMAATRAPLPEALALAYKLSRTGDGYRYSTSSGVFEHGDRRVVAAGFQPFAVYEVAMASVAPDLARRDAPGSAEDVFAWARFPLATAEVAELRGIPISDARTELEQGRREVHAERERRLLVALAAVAGTPSGRTSSAPPGRIPSALAVISSRRRTTTGGPPEGLAAASRHAASRGPVNRVSPGPSRSSVERRLLPLITQWWSMRPPRSIRSSSPAGRRDPSSSAERATLCAATGRRSSS